MRTDTAHFDEDTAALLRRLAERRPPPFALLYRPGAGSASVDLLIGRTATVDRLADLPDTGDGQRELLVLVPYRQITERGFACRDDGAPLTCLDIAEHRRLTVPETLALLPDRPIRLTSGRFDVPDEVYSRIVENVIEREIGNGEGANFVIKRSFVATIDNYSIESALTMFRRLLARELGTYWTFILHTGTRVLVGASPERHVTVRNRTVSMNPISGTYRYPPTGPALDGILRFLADRKEIDELYMVVDEELKMMARVCASGGQLYGPRLKEMAHLAHTEYDIEGSSALDPREILRETMFAPTVTGSPVENAYRVIRRYEPAGRGYYSGVLAYLGRGPDGRRMLDSTIVIRTADIAPDGRLDLAVGATLVRHSDPAAEVAETCGKAAGLLSVFESTSPSAADAQQPSTVDGRQPSTVDRRVSLGRDPAVQAALTARNADLSRFWLAGHDGDPSTQGHDGDPSTQGHGGDPGEHGSDASGHGEDPALAGRRVLVVDAEDTFTAMLAHQLRALGLQVTVRSYAVALDLDPYELVVLGPGPGDPRDDEDPKIAALHRLAGRLLARRQPLLAICLGHQMLARRLGLPLFRRAVPNQGIALTIDLFGTPARVGFYNTFVARYPRDTLAVTGLPAPVELCRDPLTGEVYATRGPGLRSLQFHPESVLSRDGVRVLAGQVRELIGTAVAL
jgi:phenazine biosynthesis protein phzE